MTRLTLPFEIPGYRIVRRLGLGGMATVYLAVQESLGRSVAIKVLASERMPDDEIARRFQHEARTIARLDHPHIVSIYDVGRTSDGSIYYTMPYLPNGDLLARHLRDDPQRVLDVVRALAEALGFAHDQGIVHRDVKPENVLFDKLDRPMLADFGIALSSSHALRVTREGATIGSSGYMSPEQARGQPIDGRSDLYSLGVLCYELLTGELPFQGADSLAVALAHIEKPIPRLPVTRRLWQPFVDKALAKPPDARFQSAEEMLAALAVIEKRLKAPPQFGLSKWWLSLVERTVAIPRRRRAVALGVATLVALAGLLALLPRKPERAAPPPAAAAVPAESATTATTATTAPEAAAGASAEQAPEAAPAPEPPAALTLEQRLKEAAVLVERGRLVAPAGANASERYLQILADEPRQRDALKGVARVLNLLATRAATAIAGPDPGAALDPIGAGISLADRAQLGDGPAFAAFAAPIRRAVEERRARRADPFDTSQARALLPLQPMLTRLDPQQALALRDDLERPQRLLAEGGAFRDADGPPLVIVPSVLAASGHVERAFAISTGDVTRGAYERFVEGTGRATATCRESQRLFARSDGLSWRNPGFTQADDHPVVCVSWEDASAYASWLSRKTGARYRLPTQREWLLVAQPAERGTVCGTSNIGKHGGCDDGYAQTAPVGRFAPTPPGLYDIAGNVSDWIDGCATSDAANCRERLFRGLSWRDDGDESNLARIGRSGGDVGYVTVGFRLVRELPEVKG